MLDKIKRVRGATGVGVMEVKRALEEASGDEMAAIGLLKKRGTAVAAKRADHSTSQGLIESYVHLGKVGVLVEVNCETDFVAKCDDFKRFVREVALQTASADCQGVDELLKTRYFRDESKTVQDLLEEILAKTGESIKIKRFVKFVLSEK